MANQSGNVDIERLKQVELDVILARKQDSDAGKAHPPSTWGLALSGGGIRSATFSLGVLQVLASEGAKEMLRGFHYLSTISGGGYTGGFLQGLIKHRGLDEAIKVLQSSIHDRARQAQAGITTPSANDPLKPILYLREYSNYLSPRKSPLSGDTLGMVGTFVRNVLLIQIQLFALLIVLSLLPVALFKPLAWAIDHHPYLLLMFAILSGLAAAKLLGWVTRSAAHPGTKSGAGEPDPAAAGSTVAVKALLVVCLLAVMVTLAAMGLMGIAKATHGGVLGIGPSWCAGPLCASYAVAIFGVPSFLYFAVWMAWVKTGGLKRQISQDPDMPTVSATRRLIRYTWATFAASLLLGLLVSVVWQLFLAWDRPSDLWNVMLVGPLCVLGAVELTAIVHLGLAGWTLSDLQREVWARIGGKAAGLVVVGITVSLALVTYGPWLLASSLASGKTALHAAGWAGVISWILTTGAGVFAAYSKRAGDPRDRAPWLDLLVRLAPWCFVLGLLLAVSTLSHYVLSLEGWHDLIHGGAQLYVENLTAQAMQLSGHVWIAVLIACAVWLLFGASIDINEFSMNAFYRNRIVRCYLGASNADRKPEPITNFDPADDLLLKSLVNRAQGAPRPLYPLIGTTLNLVATEELDWQDRKAASFCITPGYCGYLPPPSHLGALPVGDPAAAIAGTAVPLAQAPPAPSRTAETQRSWCIVAQSKVGVAETMTLGSAVAISGAAVSPNMGYHSSPAATFLLTMFDARLGWWLLNPAGSSNSCRWFNRFFGTWLIREMLGLTSERGRYIYLSDGGHFENLGIYELVRRGCHFILAVDASADPNREFEDLGNAIQKCRIDFGVEITIDVESCRRNGQGISSRGFSVGTIKYPDEHEPLGTLLYVKPSLTGGEPPDIACYARANPSFPHESTANQFFDEAQFESYRRLGEYMAEAAIVPVVESADSRQRTHNDDSIEVQDSALKESILIELQRRWGQVKLDDGHRSLVHKQAMSALLAKLRSNASLTVLDTQFYPAWADLLTIAPSSHKYGEKPVHALRRQLPRREDFRDCFYFCQELMQQMEAVYDDLALENHWDHTDNRGWMNTFRHWCGSPVFRVSWALGSPTLGSSFVSFCEMRLRLPRLSDIVVVEKREVPLGDSWTRHCELLHKAGDVNRLEYGLLRSSAIQDAIDQVASEAAERSGKKPTDRPAVKIALLRLRWREVLPQDKEKQRRTTLGMAVLCGETIVTFRIQDHLRHMGLGGTFMQLLLDQYVVSGVRIVPGHYGVVGVCGTSRARRYEDRVNALLVTARVQRRGGTEANKLRKQKTRSHESPQPAQLAPGADEGGGTAAP